MAYARRAGLLLFHSQFLKATQRLQGDPRPTFIRLRRFQVTKRHGVIVPIGTLLEQWGKGRVQRGALSTQFIQVVCFTEGRVIKCEKGLGGFLGDLLAMEDRAGRLGSCQQACCVDLLSGLRKPASGLIAPPFVAGRPSDHIRSRAHVP